MAKRVNTTLRIRGLDCAEEVKLLRKHLGGAPGIRELGFDVVHGKMHAAYDPAQISIVEMIERVEAAGMKAEPWHEASAQQEPAIGNLRWIAAIASGLALGAAMIAENVAPHTTAVIVLSLVAIACGVLYSGPKAITSLRALRFDMNVLMCVSAAGACYLGEWTEGATLSFLFSIANLLESWSMGRARSAIGALMKDAPREAMVLHGRGVELDIDCCGEHHCDRNEASIHEHRMPVDHVSIGALVRVRPGETIPLDGKVSSGAAGVNQASITGEAAPVLKQMGDAVFAGTLNTDGLLDIRTSHAAEDTTLARIVRMVEESRKRRAPSEQFVERFARIYTPVVMALALAVFLIPPFALGSTWHHALYQSMVVLLISCPCALVISTPVAIAAALASAARHGVLIKGGAFLEAAGKLRAFAFDKTGVVTTGNPMVVSIEALNGSTESEVLRAAGAIELGSEHPLGQAIRRHADTMNVSITESSGFRAYPGRGASAKIEGDTYWIGSERMLSEIGLVKPESKAAEWEASGHTVVFVGTTDRVSGLIALTDELRPGIAQSIKSLRALGVVETTILTGDNRATAVAAAKAVGADGASGELLPDDKVSHIRALQAKHGAVAMVGDGINDAQAMTEATVGIAIGNRTTDVAMEAADVIVMSEDPERLPYLVRLSQRSLRVIRQNVGVALGSKAIFLVLAFLGMATLWMAIAADMGATLVVTFNGVRLLSSRDEN